MSITQECSATISIVMHVITGLQDEKAEMIRIDMDIPPKKGDFFEIKHFDIPLDSWSKTTPPLKILHMSDIHDTAAATSVMAERCMKLNPDVIAITGDVLDKRGIIFNRNHSQLKSSINRMVEFLSYFKAPHLLFVSGNNEQFEEADTFFENIVCSGWEILNNRSITIDHYGQEVIFAGVDDPHTDHDNLNAAMHKLPESNSRPPLILLAHSPDIAGDALSENVDLLLCGHTHGGQIRFPLAGALITETKLFRKYADGLHRFNSMWMFINRGLGYSSLPIRIDCPPEIAFLNILSSGPADNRRIP